MFDEQTSHDTTKTGLELFCDVEVFLGINMYYSHVVWCLSKFAQNWDIFICNFVVVVKKCEAQLYQMYCDQ